MFGCAPNRAQKSIGQTAKCFSSDGSGSIAILFALSTMIVVSLVGGAVDIGRWLNAKSQTQAALDSAVLAAGRTLQVSGGDQNAAIETATKHFNSMKSVLPYRNDVTFEVVSSGSTVRGTVSGAVATPFFAVTGIDELEINLIGEAILSAGSSGKTHYDISIMLDVTGSMQGQKLTDLQTAAKDLINIVIWEDQSEYQSRVALVPFSESVNVGQVGAEVTANASMTGQRQR